MILGDSWGFPGILGVSRDSRGFSGIPGVSRGFPGIPGKSNPYSGNRRLIALRTFSRELTKEIPFFLKSLKSLKLFLGNLLMKSGSIPGSIFFSKPARNPKSITVKVFPNYYHLGSLAVLLMK